MVKLFTSLLFGAQRWILPIAAAASLAGCVLASASAGGPGFPLDDAWIHQTYARSLAESGAWAFNPGQPSAGSTAPLWTLLLAVGHVLGVSPLAWAFALGWACLWALGEVGGRYIAAISPARLGASLLGALLLIFDWRMAWAGASGMESLLMALLALSVLAGLAFPRPRWLLLGALTGLSAWVRPDGITLLAPLFLASLLLPGMDFEERRQAQRRMLIGCGALFSAYLLFNRALAGAWWPNTFYAKQAEYAALRLAPLWLRLAQQSGTALVGVGAVLLPGFVLRIAIAFKRREWPVLLAAAWFAGYLALYAWRLPVTYQHGRYLIPALPVYLMLAFSGLLSWAPAVSAGRGAWVLSRAWWAAAAVVLVAFWGVGARAYARDVAVIEGEMAAAARWVARCTPEQAVVAAHDIGALGYFGGRQVVDLAGLISPQVIPFITDEARLQDFLDQAQVDYLMTFPGWYPVLSQVGQAVYTGTGQAAPSQGGENMVVYAWPSGQVYNLVGSAACAK